MRIAIAGFMHESNTFSPVLTDRNAFAAQSLIFGDRLLDEWRDAHHEVGGFIGAASMLGFEPVPILMAWAIPSGPVADNIYDEIASLLIDGIRVHHPDGLLLALHGAMVTESYADADGELLARLRRTFGPDFPIAVTFDLHGNLSSRAIASCDLAVAYRTYPHIDQRECGQRAASLLMRMLRKEIHPVQAIAKPPMIIDILAQDTARPPMKPLMDEARALESKRGILAASLLPGFTYSDVPHIGPSVVVVTDGDANLAQTEADKLSANVWSIRSQLSTSLPDARAAVAQAMESDRLPVVLVDCGDNVGGGSAGDGTVLLEQLLRQGATQSVVCLFAPNEVRQCATAGVNNEVKLLVGGKVDRLHGDPVAVTGRVRLLHDGNYVEPQPRHGGLRFNHMGLTAVVQTTGDNLLVLNSQRHPPFSLGQITCLGIQPERQRVLVVKAAIAYKAAYAPIAGTIIEVDTPGLTAVNPKRFTYRHVRRPLFPLDP